MPAAGDPRHVSGRPKRSAVRPCILPPRKRNHAGARGLASLFSPARCSNDPRTGDATDLEAARSALLSVNPARLKATESSELHLGMAELMFIDDQFGTATEMFEVALDRPGMVPAQSRDRVLEWWAASLDRYAQLSPDTHRMPKYWRC